MDTVIGEFIDLAPACVQTTSLKIVLECFGQKRCEQIVIIDKQQRPLGLLRLSTLLPNWAALTTSLLPLHSMTANQQEVDLQDCSIQELMDAATLPLLEPLMLLWQHSSLQQFQHHLSDLQRHQYGLIDHVGRYQGLLDRLQLLQFLIARPAESIAPTVLTSPNPAVLSLAASEAGDRGKSPDSTPLFHLINLLEQLPLPLMLQTSTGQVVSQNQTWQQQVGELQDPQEIRQAAAIWLRTTLEADPQPLSDWKPQSESIDAVSFCYSSDANSCVCVCPMKNGQDQIWKFIKIPLDLSPDRGVTLTDHQYFSLEDVAHWATLGYCPLPELSSSSASFQLAMLELAPKLSERYKLETLPAVPDALWLILAQETTEQQQVTKELTAKNADLIQLNHLKDEFLACISHELKTPLTAILGLSSLLKDQSLGALNDRQTRYARMIHQSGRHLVLIVNNILDLTRIETGQLDLLPEMVGLEGVCKNAYEQACQAHRIEDDDEITASAANIHQEPSFSLEIEPEIDSLIADRLRLRQMLSNLLSNALKSTQDGGKIGLQVERWERWIAFTVWDTGMGISTNKQHLIFQKFQQLENPLTRQFEGTGLGLVLTQRLAQLHGGDVSFTSIEGQGSQFTLLLPPSPLQANPIYADSLATPVEAALNRLVLIVEAVPQVLERLTQHLSDFGYRVVIARSSTEALEKARRLQPAAIVLNPALSMLSGWDLLTLLKSEQKIRHIPIIVTATQMEKTQAFHNGADGFISLPVQPEVLHQTLTRLIYPQTPAPTVHPLSKLTVLHLSVGNVAGLGNRSPDSQAALSASPIDLYTLLHPYHCRILEVDDLDQADLLARVWKPNVILLDGTLINPIAYLKRLSQCPFLASMPLVTLTPEITQAANQVGKLAVFPCLADATAAADLEIGEPSTLLQVLQVAAEVNWTPHILLVDLGALPDSIAETEWEGITTPTNLSTDMPTIASNEVNPMAEWLQATAQYLQTVGFKSSVTDSWSQIMHHLHHQNVDLLLLRTHRREPHPSVLRALQTLTQLTHKPPILVWQDDFTAEITTEMSTTERAVANCASPKQGKQSGNEVYIQLLRAIATQFLAPSLPMKDLLEQINFCLRKQ